MERDEEELIKIIRAWYPLFEIDKEASIMIPDELVFDVKELAHKYGVKIQILKCEEVNTRSSPGFRQRKKMKKKMMMKRSK